MRAENEPRTPSTPPGLVIREATGADNATLIALELQSPLLVGGLEETFDRSPDAFACCRLQDGCRVVIAELDGRAVGLMAGFVHAPLLQGQPRRLVYIHRARVHPDFHHRGIALALSNSLFRWSGERGAIGPYYVIAPDNEPSITFVGQGGGRWPVDISLAEIDVSGADGGHGEPVPESRLPDVVELVNASHAGEDFFEPLTVESLTARLLRDGQYSTVTLRGVFEGGALIAVAGLWDKGATTERIFVDRETGVTTRSRSAVVADWGYVPGRADALAELLRSLAAQTRALGRPTLIICEPSAGAIPDIGLPRRRTSALGLFTPSVTPPPAEPVRGLFADLLCL